MHIPLRVDILFLHIEDLCLESVSLLAVSNGLVIFETLSLFTDSGGKVRIWDTTNKEHILKNEYQPIGGAIRDVAWDGESKRIVVGGEGRDK